MWDRLQALTAAATDAQGCTVVIVPQWFTAPAPLQSQGGPRSRDAERLLSSRYCTMSGLFGSSPRLLLDSFLFFATQAALFDTTSLTYSESQKRGIMKS